MSFMMDLTQWADAPSARRARPETDYEHYRREALREQRAERARLFAALRQWLQPASARLEICNPQTCGGK